MTTGERIKAARKKAKMTQAALGLELGVSGSMVAQYETGARNPKYKTLERIAEKLGVSVSYLQGLDDAIADLEIVGMSIEDIAEEMNVPAERIREIINYKEPHSIEINEKIVRVAQLLVQEERKHQEEATQIIEHTKAKIAQVGPLHKLSDSEAHKAGFLTFNSEEDRIAHFYRRLNTDGKLAASRCFYQHLNPDALSEVADYVEKLSETSQYQSIPSQEDE